MLDSVFEFVDYKTYLRDWLAAHPHGGHGLRSKLAKAAGCHVAYVTQVLGGAAHFSHEQGIAVGDYLGLTEEELDFFLLLIAAARAGSTRLKRHYDKKIRAVREARRELKNVLKYRDTISPEVQARYYSAWYYLAAHLLVTMPRYQSPVALEERLGLGPERTNEIVRFLCETGLAIQEKGKLSASPLNMHLGSDSPMIAKHHTNWRLRAMQSLERGEAESVHYSSVITVAKDDVPKIRKVLLRAVEEIRKLVRESREDSLYCYNLDLFEVV